MERQWDVGRGNGKAYATQHAIGVVAWMEVDSKVTDSQRMAVLKMA